MWHGRWSRALRVRHTLLLLLLLLELLGLLRLFLLVDLDKALAKLEGEDGTFKKSHWGDVRDWRDREGFRRYPRRIKRSIA